MPFRYEEAVPWGRSFDEYRRMFALTDADLARRILGCADGPASFNAGMKQRGKHVVSCDPLYQFSAAQIQSRIDATYATVVEQTRQNQDKFRWDVITSPDEMARVRMNAMKAFLADYETGAREGRYVTAELPDLPFADDSFELAVSSHFLLFYADNFSLDFHHQAVAELCRVAAEVRIFPVVTYNADPSPHLAPVMARLAQRGYQATVETVTYEFQRGGNQMLRIRRA